MDEDSPADVKDEKEFESLILQWLNPEPSTPFTHTQTPTPTPTTSAIMTTTTNPTPTIIDLSHPHHYLRRSSQRQSRRISLRDEIHRDSLIQPSADLIVAKEESAKTPSFSESEVDASLAAYVTFCQSEAPPLSMLMWDLESKTQLTSLLPIEKNDSEEKEFDPMKPMVMPQLDRLRIEIKFSRPFLLKRHGQVYVAFQTLRQGKALVKVRPESDLPSRPNIIVRALNSWMSQHSVSIQMGIALVDSQNAMVHEEFADVFVSPKDLSAPETNLVDSCLHIRIGGAVTSVALWNLEQKFFFAFRHSNFDYITRYQRSIGNQRKLRLQNVLDYQVRLRFLVTDDAGIHYGATSNLPILLLAHKKHVDVLGFERSEGQDCREELLFEETQVNKRPPKDEFQVIEWSIVDKDQSPSTLEQQDAPKKRRKNRS